MRLLIRVSVIGKRSEAVGSGRIAGADKVKIVAS